MPAACWQAGQTELEGLRSQLEAQQEAHAVEVERLQGEAAERVAECGSQRGASGGPHLSLSPHHFPISPVSQPLASHWVGGGLDSAHGGAKGLGRVG